MTAAALKIRHSGFTARAGFFVVSGVGSAGDRNALGASSGCRGFSLWTGKDGNRVDCGRIEEGGVLGGRVLIFAACRSAPKAGRIGGGQARGLARFRERGFCGGV